MAAQRSHLARTLSGSGSSPKTPSSTALTETVPLHITPLDSLDSDREPNTPNKVKLMCVSLYIKLECVKLVLKYMYLNSFAVANRLVIQDQ